MRRDRVGANLAKTRAAYVLELARGCSYISSTLTPDTCSGAITEVLDEFRRLYGDEEMALFQKLLAEDLQRRNKSSAASAVLEFKLPSA